MTARPSQMPLDAPGSVAPGTPVRVAGVVRRFTTQAADPVEVLAGIDLDVPASQFVALLGPSGCGKSTLLRLVAGLDAPEGGSVIVGGRPLRGREPPDDMAFVFQEAHLLPWRTLSKNVQLPLELRGMASGERRDRALHMLERVGLADACERYPSQLSGGMQLRGSLARALVTEPRLLLLDEPFAALDEITRERLDGLVQEIWRERRFTALFVTHSLREAVFLAQRAVMFSRRPARVVADRAIEFPGERGSELRASGAFNDLVEQLYRDLRIAEGGA
ncbi:MAG TPA: ABC transporter ATP-binding protein [Kofleriaceae bacterium]|nr:ABC transporter ATP-binding protein [Kofleriaceae bacterium]